MGRGCLGETFFIPENKRDANTQLPQIKRKLASGSVIKSDEWAAHCGIKDLGYDHFPLIILLISLVNIYEIYYDCSCYCIITLYLEMRIPRDICPNIM